MTPKILFVLKLRHTYGGYPNVLKSSGLLNSATFVVNALLKAGYETKLVQVVDANSIDREVALFKPTLVVLEALWVVPSKLDVLKKLYPKITWIVRLHSKLPFLANEGIAMHWINEYIRKPKVYLAVNSGEAFENLYNYLKAKQCPEGLLKKLLYLPNVYPVSNKVHNHWGTWYKDIDVGCFGALRPMKNQLMQACAAVEYARQERKRLYFHINAGRIDNAGSLSVLKNIRSFFRGLSDQFILVEHEWLEHEAFLKLVAQMDFGMQVSMSESFNIVAADFVQEEIPIVTSSEVTWLPSVFYADPNSMQDIIKAIRRTLFYDRILGFFGYAKFKLGKYSKKSLKQWIKVIKHLEG